ncbi:cyclo(L-tyrosyl-L-tyrosyl) synthase [Herbihabitans rhizosphaerae]|uniref:Cyclodipeptide synthase n=1 Tax=Herbihabitans rhizosphaerae TaxID=1872711 RepID=A0A4Q7KTT1_9PSEU|nr:tRNA-dependent cyclodipeptide synthase [Herbihabitans rhizosphaerae]RZS39241.1 cyclo(L-tyrosyl-L-tyrosyl) synthase [Herbihabitans rhizosphaerae]
MFNEEPLTPNCESVRESGAHACVGISPFNGYYTASRIADLVAWAKRSFDYYHFFVPDAAAAYTLEALGYEPKKARQKARRQGNLVYNKISRALAEQGVHDAKRHILDSARLDTNPRYRELHAEVTGLFEKDEEFRTETMGSSEWVLAKRLPPGCSPTPRQRELAVRYFLAELPLFLDTPTIVGRPSSVFVYHQRVTYLERLYQGELARRPDLAQGFLVVAPDEVTPDEDRSEMVLPV